MRWRAGGGRRAAGGGERGKFGARSAEGEVQTADSWRFRISSSAFQTPNSELCLRSTLHFAFLLLHLPLPSSHLFDLRYSPVSLLVWPGRVVFEIDDCCFTSARRWRCG